MPDVTQAGTYTKDDPGFEFLSGSFVAKVILFAGNSLGDSCELQYIDDEDTPRTPENGQVLYLPRSVNIGWMRRDLQLVVTGTPDFNVTSGE